MNVSKTRSLLSRLASPITPADEHGPGPLLVVLWIAVTAFAQVVRQPGVPSWDSIWQEDGGIFLSDALARRFVSTIVLPYNAYLHVVPRLIAGVAAAVPVDASALVLSVSSAVVVSLLSVYVYFASAWLLSTRWARVTLALLVVLLPATAYETTANVANLHWYLLFACFWVFVADWRSRWWLAVGAVVAVAAVLSDPLAGLFLPLALLQALRADTWRGRVVPVLFSLGLAAQLLLGAFQASPQPYANAYVRDLPGIFGLRVAGSFLTGDRFLGDLWRHLGWAFVGVSLAVVMAIAAYGLSRRDLPRFWLTVALAYSAILLAVPLMLRGTENFLSRANFTLNGSRYTVLPILFLAVAVLMVLDRRDPRVATPSWTRVQGAFVLVTAGLVVTNYADFSVRTPGPSWKASLANARRVCEGRAPVAGAPSPERLGPEVAARVGANKAWLLIPISPNLLPAVPWAVATTCERIR